MTKPPGVNGYPTPNFTCILTADRPVKLYKSESHILEIMLKNNAEDWIPISSFVRIVSII